MLETSGVFTVRDDPLTPAKLAVVLNNHGDLEAATRAGVQTGFSFGSKGNFVTDYYSFVTRFEIPSNIVRKTYEHEITSAIGSHDPPAGIPPMSLDDAFHEVFEQLVGNLLQDLAIVLKDAPSRWNQPR